MPLKNDFFDIKENIASLLSEHISLEKGEIKNLIEVPPSQDFGDYAFPCFILSKILKKSPKEIAEILASKIKSSKNIEKIEAKGPYVNFFINRKLMAEEILKINENYGRKKKKKEKIMVEFSQANTHKAFHIGHLRGTSLGESIARILEFLGNKVIRVNYQGDTGMHVAKWLWCYLKYHKKEKLKEDERWIANIYVDAVRRLENDKTEKLQKEVEEINRKLEKKEDKELNKLWECTRKISLKMFERIYKELDTKFDKYFFEREVEKRGKEIAKELLKKKIAKISEGAEIVDLKKFGLGVWILLRKDGTVLYSAKDLALAEKKFTDFKIDKSIYVVGAAQKLHFEQLMKTLEIMKFKNLKNIKIIHFQEVRFPHGKMSSRTGENILYSDFKSELIDYAKQEIKKRHPNIFKPILEKRALDIFISAIKYSMLKQDPNKNIIFIKEEAFNFEGNTGPYLLYSYARASSILKKAKKVKKKVKFSKLTNQEIALIKKIFLFPEIVEKAGQSLNPSLIANYSHELAQLFNEFYHSCRVIGEKSEEFRLKLVDAFRICIKNALYLLGIKVLEEM